MTTNQTISFPRELSDELGELIAEKARVCGGGALDIWEAICEQFGTSDLRPRGNPEGKREYFEKWVMATKHPVFGFLDGRSLARSDDRTGYADEYVQGLWVAYLEFGAAQPQGEPVALFAKGFTTLETGDGKYRIVTSYQNRDDAWADYTVLCKAEQPAPVAVESLEIVGRQCFPSETMKKIPNYRTEPWVDGDVHQSPSIPDLYRVEPLVRLSDVTRLNTK